MSQQEQLGGLVRHDYLVVKLLHIDDIIVELVDISLVMVAQHAAGHPLTTMVDKVEAVALAPEIPRQLLILEVAFYPAVDDQDGAINLLLPQRGIADGDAILALELSFYGMLAPEVGQGLLVEGGHIGFAGQRIGIGHGKGSGRKQGQGQQGDREGFHQAHSVCQY